MSDSSKKRKAKKKKDSQLIIRINSDDREAFIEKCEDLDTSAAREIRRFIREFLSHHEQTDQQQAPQENNHFSANDSTSAADDQP